MAEQSAADPVAESAKTDGPMPKPPKRAGKSKTGKNELLKTSFSGRVEEVSVGENDALSFELRDKRGKRHKFAVPGGSVARLLLLTSALASRGKCQVETSAADHQLVQGVSLRGRK